MPASPGEEKILILDFGSQYTQVIARRIRECKVYSEILPHWTKAADILTIRPQGIILSGGPASVYTPNAPRLDPEIYNLGIPILGICYGMQLIAHDLGGKVEPSDRREYGPSQLKILHPDNLLHRLPPQISVWNSHGDKITSPPKGFHPLAETENSRYAAIADEKRNIYGLQFHPEVAHTPKGKTILQNFLSSICKCHARWTMGSFIQKTCQQIRQQVGNDNVILGLSGGVDSSVAAALIHQAIGDQLTCIFVDNGLLRANEADAVKKIFSDQFHIRLKTINASDQFLSSLRGISDPEKKRKTIGNLFIRTFESAARELKRSSPGKYRFLAQGTLYPDVIESVPISGNPAALIKSHHNVGGLPARMKFQLIEPLRQLFKDEVRKVGAQLGLSKEILHRQPFPGPGLAVRIIGEITPEKLNILRAADAIVLEEMKSSGWYYKVWQSFAVLLPVKSVGVMGDERTYAFTIVLRVVESRDGMTADWVRLPSSLLAKISSRIINEVQGVNRVCYDISSKPPSTIEWE